MAAAAAAAAAVGSGGGGDGGGNNNGGTNDNTENIEENEMDECLSYTHTHTRSYAQRTEEAIPNAQISSLAYYLTHSIFVFLLLLFLVSIFLLIRLFLLCDVFLLGFRVCLSCSNFCCFFFFVLTV